MINQHNFDETVATLGPNDKIIQIFKAVEEDIHGINIIAKEQEYIADVTTIDDFDSYADQAALEAVWVETSPHVNTTLVTGAGAYSGQSMSFDITYKSLGQYVTIDFGEGGVD